MTAKDAINEIVNLLGLKFKSEKFASTFLVDGETEVTNNLDEEFKVGQELYVVRDSTLAPAPEGEHETREGLIITVDSGSVITSLAQKAEEAPANEDDAVEEEIKTDEVLEEETTESKEVSVEDILEILAPMVEEMRSLREEMKKMRDGYSGELDTIKNEFEQFKKQPDRSPVEKKATVVETFSDFKLELLKSIPQRK